MGKNKKRQIVLVFILIAVTSVSIIGTYAYFITQAGRNEEQKLTIKTGNLALIFEDNDEGLTVRMEIGKSYSKEFRIKNAGTEVVTTNMIWSGLVNTYLEESLSYTLQYRTTEDEEWQSVETSHTNVPQTEIADNYNLATGLTIPANTTYYYKVMITFNNLSNINQEQDKNALLTTKFKLGDEISPKTSDDVLKYLKLISKIENPNFDSVPILDETATDLYKMEDDYGMSYYYRGASENNYVKFGGFYWRIIRINGDGSIRMQYDGTQAWPNANGSTGSGEEDRFALVDISWNENDSDSKYAGWMYGNTDSSISFDDSEKNEVSSNIKNVLDNWYKENIYEKNLHKYISDEIFVSYEQFY